VREKGTIIRLIPDRGFGFVRATDLDNIGGDIFFHAGAVRGPRPYNQLSVDDRVTFELQQQPDGRYRAVDVETEEA
jgi:cold shock CspA family protein